MLPRLHLIDSYLAKSIAVPLIAAVVLAVGAVLTILIAVYRA